MKLIGVLIAILGVVVLGVYSVKATLSIRAQDQVAQDRATEQAEYDRAVAPDGSVLGQSLGLGPLSGIVIYQIGVAIAGLLMIGFGYLIVSVRNLELYAYDEI